MSTCLVHLENYSGTYHAGSQIRGTVVCNFTEITKVRSIKIRISSEEYNSWRSFFRKGDQNEALKSNIVLFFETKLFSPTSGSTRLPSGKHTYHFFYHLPHEIPSTFNGPYGYIKYSIKAIVDRPRGPDYEDTLVFNVLSPIHSGEASGNLHDIATYSTSRTVFSWCWYGSASMDVELPKKVFVIGESIPFRVHISNKSKSKVRNLNVKLVKTVTSRMTLRTRGSKLTVYIIKEFYEHGVDIRCERTYSLNLQIPKDVEVPNFQKCTLFGVHYHLLVSAGMPWCTMGLGIKIEGIEMCHC